MELLKKILTHCTTSFFKLKIQTLNISDSFCYQKKVHEFLYVDYDKVEYFKTCSASNTQYYTVLCKSSNTSYDDVKDISKSNSNEVNDSNFDPTLTVVFFSTATSLGIIFFCCISKYKNNVSILIDLNKLLLSIWMFKNCFFFLFYQ